MPSNGRLPPRRRARRVVYQLVADFLSLVVAGRVRFGDLDELARAAKLWKHPKSSRWIPDDEREDVDVDELKAAMLDVEVEMRRAVSGRRLSPAKGHAGTKGRR
jgi:hypothetical protein